MDVAEIARGLSQSLRVALSDVAGYDKRGGYVWNWKPKSRERLQAAGLVGPLVKVHRQGHNINVCHLTDLGRSVAALLKK